MCSLHARIPALVAVAMLSSACGGSGPTTETTAVETLAAALSSAAEIDSYRIEMATGNDISSSALGVDSATELDPDNPAAVTVVTPQGAHTVIDVGALLGPLGAGERVVLEMWMTDQEMIFDTTSYRRLVDANPFVDLGPLAPGVFSVDAASIAELRSSDVVSAVGGQSVDVVTLAERLPAELADIEPLDEPGAYRGTTSMAGVIRALGTDVEDAAAGASAGLSLAATVDAAALSRAYVEFYESTEVELVVVVERGLLSTMEYEADVAGLYDFLFADERAREIFGMTAVEAQQARVAFADTEWVQSSLTTFIPDDDGEFDPPTVNEDRTEEFVAFLEASGAFD